MVWSTESAVPAADQNIIQIENESNIKVKSAVDGDDADNNTRCCNLKQCRKYFREYCANTSIHGLKYLSEKRTVFERVLWTVLIILAFGCCAYLITNIYNKYEESPFIVSFATRESPIYTIPFPAVTICPISKTYKKSFDFTQTVQHLWDNKTVEPYQLKSGQYMQLICDLPRSNKHFPSNETFTDDFFVTLDKNKPLFDMVFGGCKIMGESGDCDNIFYPVIVDDGLCYSFNLLDRSEMFKKNVVQFSDYHHTENFSTDWSIDKGYQKDAGKYTYPYRALLAGADNALEVFLLQKRSDIDYLCAKDVQGFNVLLHPPNDIPRLKKDFFTVPLDYTSMALVQPKMMTTSEKVKKFRPDDRECYMSHERFLKFFKIYTPDNCQLECLTNYTLEICGCVNFYMPRENSTPICGNSNIECMKEAEYQLKELEISKQLDDDLDYDFEMDFACDCMPLCSELTYEVENTQAPWNWREEFEAERADRLLPGFQTELSVSKLAVFFKQDRFLTSQRNELYGPTDFLANFGGLLGLFTGFSLLSLAEIIYFLTVRLWVNVIGRRGGRGGGAVPREAAA